MILLSIGKIFFLVQLRFSNYAWKEKPSQVLLWIIPVLCWNPYLNLSMRVGQVSFVSASRTTVTVRNVPPSTEAAPAKHLKLSLPKDKLGFATPLSEAKMAEISKGKKVLKYRTEYFLGC